MKILVNYWQFLGINWLVDNLSQMISVGFVAGHFCYGRRLMGVR